MEHFDDTQNMEHFDDTQNMEHFDDTNVNITGHYENDMGNRSSEFRLVDFQPRRKTVDIKNFRRLMWETKLPSLVDKRYSYNDYPNNDRTFPSVNEFSYLKELPLDLTNKYYAKLDLNKCSHLLEDNYYNPTADDPERHTDNVDTKTLEIYGFDYDRLKNTDIQASAFN
jgi:hypothetical protein